MQPTTRCANPRSIDALQGLRAAAALLVVLDHAIAVATIKLNLDARYQEFGYFIGLFGVKMFFIISGFVMVLSHSGDFGRHGAPTRFLARRLGRIMPLYWIMTLIFLVFGRSEPGAAEIAWSLLLIPHQSTGGPFGWPVYILGWTLQYELFFYLLFAGGLLFSRKVGLALVSGALLLLAAASASGALGAGNVLAYLGRPIILYFLGGLVIGIMRPWFLRRERRPGFAVAILVALAAIAIGCAAGWPRGNWDWAQHGVCTAAAMLAVMACALSNEEPRVYPARRVARALGDATYSIYLTHPLALFPITLLAAQFPGAVPWPAFLLLSVVLSAALGLTVYRCVERPLVRRVGSLIGQWPGIGGRSVGAA